jgi:V-type H+-transporting ATPase subunit G
MLILSTDRTKRVKDARSEAQKEIDEYKSSKDKEFKSFEEKVRLLAIVRPFEAG